MAVGHIPVHSLNAFCVPISVFHCSFQDLDITYLTVGENLFLDIVKWLSRLHGHLIVATVFDGHFRIVYINVSLTNQFFERHVKEVTHALVGKYKSPLVVFAINTDRQALNQRQIDGLGLGQSALCGNALGHVPGNCGD